MSETLDDLVVDEFENETITDSDQEAVLKIKDRFESMDLEKSNMDKKDAEWDMCENQIDAEIEYTNDGKASVNVPLEQNIIEQKIGEQPIKIEYKLDPEGVADIAVLEPLKYVMDYFLSNENTFAEILTYKYQKAMYGTGILFIGVWKDIRTFYNNEGEDGFYDTKHHESEIKDVWHIGMKNVSIRDFWIDEKALTMEQAMDCIWREQISIEELRKRYGKDKNFKYINSVGEYVDDKKSSNNNDQNYNSQRNCMLWHYYNKITSDYVIIANRSLPIYIGKTRYAHGELPFTAAQEYRNTRSFYGISVPKKLRSVKPYLNNFYKIGLDKAWKASGEVIVLGNSGVIDGEPYIEPGDVSIWNFNGDASKNQQLRFDDNLSSVINMMKVIHEMGIENTGVNVRSSFINEQGTAFQAGLVREAGNARLSTTKVLNDVAMDRALTMMLKDIQQFAPSLYAEKIFDKNGKVESIKYPNIVIPDIKIKKKGGKITFEESNGDFANFELNPDVIRGQITVRVVTPSTDTLFKALERQDMVTYLDNVVRIANIDPKILENISGKEILDKLNLINGIDSDKIKVKTKQDKRREEVGSLLEALRTPVTAPVEGEIQDQTVQNTNSTLDNVLTSIK